MNCSEQQHRTEMDASGIFGDPTQQSLREYMLRSTWAELSNEPLLGVVSKKNHPTGQLHDDTPTSSRAHVFFGGRSS